MTTRRISAPNTPRQPRLSVVLATYNGERYLAAQLQSIARQTLLPDELVIGDDSSQDSTIDILSAFRRNAPFEVRITRHERLGLAENFLRTFEASTGELVAFADQDDVWLPTKLERSTYYLHRYHADLVTHAALPVDEDLRRLRTGNRTAHRLQIRSPLRGPIWPQHQGNTMLFRRSLLDHCDWTQRPRTLGGHLLDHDHLVDLLTFVSGRSVRAPDRLLLYRQHADNACGARPVARVRLSRYAQDDATLIESIEDKIAILGTWKDYFGHVLGPKLEPAVTVYFDRAQTILRCRIDRLRRPPLSATSAILLAGARGEYAPSGPAALGWGSLIRDFYHCGRAARLRTSPEGSL